MVQKILQWNVRGLRTRTEDLRVLISETNPTCMCLQELKLPDTNTGFSFDKNYNTYIKLPPDNDVPKGGALIAVKKIIPHNSLPLNTPLQAVAIELYGEKLQSICSIYLPPNENITINQLHTIINQLPKPALLMGDFNAHSPLWYDTRQDHRGIMLERFVAAEDLVSLGGDHPTYFKTHNNIVVTSHIDLSLISSTCATDFSWSALDDLHGSDHYPVILSNLHTTPEIHGERWNLLGANWSLYSDLAIPAGEPEDYIDLKDMYKHLMEIITSACNAAIPKINVNRSRRPFVPWWNKECKNHRSAVRSAYRRMTRNPTPVTINIYKRRLALKTRVYKKAKINSWRSYISNLNARTPSSKVWQKIKKINGHYTPRPAPTLSVNGNHLTSHQEVANAFAFHYSAVSTGPALPLHQGQQRCRNHNIDHHYNQDFNLRELNGALDKAKSDSSPGEDQICNEMLKHLPLVSKTFLLKIFNRIWTEGVIPEEWRVSIIIPIHKHGKIPTDPRSYRPFSLTSSVCKIFERMVNSRLVWFLEKYHHLAPQQYGFRQNRNSIDPIAALTTDILNGFSNRQSTTAVFFDVEKAFDTISRPSVIESLYQMGIQGKMLTFIQSFLKERLIKVRICGTLSDPYPTNIGVPQGGILSVTCFTVAINSILNNLPDQVKASLYADDLVIYHTTTNPNTSVRQLQLAIRGLENWALRSGLRFSPAKSEVVCFQRSGKRRIVPDILPQLYNQDIPFKETTKFLGVTLDTRLSWVPHLKTLKADALRSLNILRVVSRVNFGPDKKTLLRLYWAICQSKLDYGAQIYSSAKSSALKILEPVHNEALRISTGAFRTSPVESLQVQAGSLPLDLRRDDLCLRYMAHLEGSDDYKNKLNVTDSQYDNIYTNNDKLQAPLGVRCRILQQEMDIVPNPIPRGQPEVAPWLLDNFDVCYHGVAHIKGTASDSQLCQTFLSHMAAHTNSNHIYTDGSKSSTGVGFGVVFGPNLTNHRRGTLPNQATIFTAELHAIILALAIVDQSPGEKWTVFTDSQSSLQSIGMTYPRHPLVQVIQTNLIKLSEQQKAVTFCKVPSHVGIHGNEAADRVANEALQFPGFATTEIPHRDYFLSIKRHTNARWQERWNRSTSHLRRIRPTVKSWHGDVCLGRRAETKIARLRIGHTRLTHGYYMSRTRPPECTGCGVGPLTLQHILIDCPTYQPERLMHKLPNNYLSILGENSPVFNLLNFLSAIQIMDEL